MDKKTYAIGLLSVTALILLLANLLAPTHTAVAGEVVKDRDYQAVTARTQRGDALYITDNRSGKMAVFVFNPNTRSLQVTAVQPLADAFAAAAGPAEGGRERERPARGNRTNR